MDIFKLVGSVFVDTEEANNSLQKTGEKAEGTASKFGTVAKNAGKVALGIGAAATAVGTAMVASAKQTASNADTIDKASQRMKIGAESYQELAHASELCGVDMSTMEQAAKKLEGTDLNLDDALAQIYELETAEERSAAAAELFGEKVAYNMTPMLNASAEEMAAMRQEAHDLGNVMSEDAVKAGAEMNDTFTKVQESFTAVTNQIGVAVMPIVSQLLQWVLDHMPEIQEAIGKVMAFVQEMVPVVMDVIQSIAPIVEELFKLIGWMWENILKPVLNAITDLLDGTFKKNFINAFQTISDKVGEIFNGMIDIVKKPINTIIGLINSFINGINSIKIPDWVPVVGGSSPNIPTIPLLAKGGHIIEGGSAIVGEAGAELIDLPAGATVTPLTNSNGGNDMLRTMEAMLDEMRALSAELPQTIASALNGVNIDWNDRQLGRLVNTYAR